MASALEAPSEGSRGGAGAVSTSSTGGLGLPGFSHEAVTAAEIDALLALACREVADGLDVSQAKFLEYLPDERRLLVRAGVGWADDVVGRAHLATDLGSPAGYALQTGQPTIANDLAVEQRFRVPDLLRDHGVRSAVNVIVQHGDAVFGVLEADSGNPREFDQRDVQFLQGYGNVLALALAQARLAQKNYELGRRLELLLHELGHRTKNNNQMLLSILGLQKRRHDMLEVRQALDDFGGRLRVLSEIDQLILASGFESTVDLGRYVVGLANGVLLARNGGAADVTLTTETASIPVDTRTAQSVAIVVNEFVTNSFKHAFRDDKGQLHVALAAEGENAVLALADDGPGLAGEPGGGLGHQLIDAMAEQLGGKAEWLSGSGTRLRLTFPIPPAEA